ncbi:hypothetical protein N7520_000262 [Penicillium odoratum]|uniref:uncharacterized protein n=1 Tax=Penicillium odoratum TaxID=1167516 RepID=UPI002547A09A|nr:uncharacterized protein N7520_000262 [Penicillium odoratum]KAJ5777016.1 hypothetical protein N7520_000262 [Penicillium odoratum]
MSKKSMLVGKSKNTKKKLSLGESNPGLPRVSVCHSTTWYWLMTGTPTMAIYSYSRLLTPYTTTNQPPNLYNPILKCKE